MESRNSALEEGTTDGKYRKSRPDTKIAPGMGAEIVKANRRSLQMQNGFFFGDYTGQVDPGSR